MKIKWNKLGLIFPMFLVACGTTPLRKEFDNTKKIQTIEWGKDSYIYAQNDIVLDSSLQTKLSKMDKDWKKDLSVASTYGTIAVTSLLLYIGSFVACLSYDGENENQERNLWCGTMFASLFSSFFFGRKAEKREYKAVEKYNQRF